MGESTPVTQNILKVARTLDGEEPANFCEQGIQQLQVRSACFEDGVNGGDKFLSVIAQKYMEGRVEKDDFKNTTKNMLAQRGHAGRTKKLTRERNHTDTVKPAEATPNSQKNKSTHRETYGNKAHQAAQAARTE